ncbi:hypothetical protein [Stenotrophomonas maltophilia]|uniref:hypothetical protein n=1 Tax=Stenotrophomonas maltophilia TaxID=40324 RepID=UPI002E761D3C|nr:hypothetical protein [Stenotrophomonas maltophilia]
MSFSRANAAYLQLRRRLATCVSESALADVTIEPPKDSESELAFLRLVAWSYAVVYETAKLPLGILRHLPPLQHRQGQLLPHVRALRTWTSHNLALDSKTDLSTLRAATAWFHSTCGTGSPSTAAHWAKCFEVLAVDIATLLEEAVAACDAFEDPVDGEPLKKEFERRMERTWEGHKFDRYVVACCEVLGYSGIDVVTFRNKNLVEWRRVVEVSEGSSIEVNLSRRIEADLLLLMGEAPPLSGTDLQTMLGLSSPEEIRAALLVLVQLKPAERRSLIDKISMVATAGPQEELGDR